jgi:hypothetical protein
MISSLATTTTKSILLSNQKTMNNLDFNYIYSKIKNGDINEKVAELLTTTPHEVLLKLKFSNSSEDYKNFSKLLKDRAKNFEWALSECFDYFDNIIAQNYRKSSFRLDSITSQWASQHPSYIKR